MDALKFQITSRVAFNRLVQTDPSTLTDLERAARFLYLQSTTFGGKVVGRTFGVQTTKGARFNISTLGPRLEDLHERLAGVVIEQLDFEDFIKRYDREYSLFYIDPPYYGTEGPDQPDQPDQYRNGEALLTGPWNWVAEPFSCELGKRRRYCCKTARCVITVNTFYLNCHRLSSALITRRVCVRSAAD